MSKRTIPGYEVIEHEYEDAPAALLALIQDWIRRQTLLGVN